MKWFKKNKETEDYQQEQKKDNNKTSGKTSKAAYKVVIKEKFGNATTTLTEVPVERYIDPDDYVVYLMNMKGNVKFLELFPQDENDNIKLTEKQVDSRLAKAREKLREEEIKDEEDVNIKNLEFDVMKYEALKRSFLYDRSAPYITIDSDGTKKFYFLRDGSTFYPFKWDTDTKTIYVSSDNKKKKAGIARRNKQLKYSKFKNVIEGSVMFMMILVCIVGLGEAFLGYKLFAKFDESEIVAAQNYCVQKGAEWTSIVEKNAKATETILDNLNKEVAQRNAIVDSFIPKTE